ncbi:helix-turn-helix domain-containing protein [Peribacillus loiseleuriae]|uniref:helix-turn-helix domain-containing protein n=1 Tax=Peribacillus loiseleuriae TaxID=1679170 RepID=UPI00382321DA
MKHVKKVGIFIDSIFEKLALTSLSALVLVVTTQVMTRKLFNFVFFWSEEVTLRISEIAERLGYSDIAYFSNTFKRMTSFSPSEFRKVKDE